MILIEATFEDFDMNHESRRLVFGADHAGYALKTALIETAQSLGFEVVDIGTRGLESVDYPDFIAPVITEVLEGAVGILICGSGIGMSIGANRYKGIRAALCITPEMAQLSRAHNNANILVLGERLISTDDAIQTLKAFLETPFEGGRHARRVEKLDT